MRRSPDSLRSSKAREPSIMGELASTGQLRASFLRWAIVTVPFILLLGLASGELGGSGTSNPWFETLVKPDIQPPGWVFGAVWTVLYVLMGVALAIVINARGAANRGMAVGLFFAQLALNLAWSPLFFGAHQLWPAFWLILAIFLAALLTTLFFGRIRPLAAWLMVPYLIWLCFAAVLTYGIIQLNPDGGQPSGAVEMQL